MDEKVLLEYFKKSYFALDGLWFVKVEEGSSFENALEIDEKVWEVLPKIQARKLKEVLGLEGKGLKDLLACLKVKFEGEGHGYEVLKEGKALEIAIRRCPWHEIMKRSRREHLSAQVGDRICATELAVWAGEFGASLKMESKICQGAERCLLRYEALVRKC